MWFHLSIFFSLWCWKPNTLTGVWNGNVIHVLCRNINLVPSCAAYLSCICVFLFLLSIFVLLFILGDFCLSRYLPFPTYSWDFLPHLLLEQVKNLISLGGPHAGTASVPLCGVSIIVAFQHDAFKISVCFGIDFGNTTWCLLELARCHTSNWINHYNYLIGRSKQI